MNQEVLNLTPGNALRQSLGFVAQTVVCDNYTSSYLVLTDVGKTIPPWYYGAVVSLPPGLNRASAQLVATTPAIPGPPVPTAEATLTWVDVALQPDPGHPLQQVTTQQETVLGTVSASAGASSTKDFTVPAGTLAVGFATYSGSGLSTAESVTIQGDQTGMQYFDVASASSSDGVQPAAFDATDMSVTVILDQTGSASGAKIDVLAWPVLPVTTIKQNQGALPPGVFLERSDGVSIDVDQGSAGAGSLRIGASLAGATAAPWQSPNLANVRIARTFPTSQATAVELIAGVANERIWIFGLSLAWDASAAASSLHLVDAAHGSPSGGTIFADVSEAVQAPAPLPVLGPLTVGHSLYAWADSGTPLGRGVLSASQG